MTTTNPEPKPFHFTRGSSASALIATFASEHSVEIFPSRIRHYPGVRSVAPATTPYYRAVQAMLDSTDVVWDVGCGSGHGTALLSEVAIAVGIDPDPEALDFARLLAPSAAFYRSVDQNLPPPGLAVIVDVLGLALEPEALLWQLRQHIPSDCQLLIAEPAACGSQDLSPPVSRAYSRALLESLLLRTGYRPVEWHCSPGDFLVCRAVASDPAVGLAFAQARLAPPDRCGALFETLLSGQHGKGVEREARLHIAERALEARDGTRAAAEYLAVLELDPRDPTACSGLAQLMLHEEPARALEFAVAAVEADPASPSAACAMAAAAQHLAPHAALEAWRYAAALSPRDPGVLSRYAELAANNGQNAVAIQALEQLKGCEPEINPNLQVTLALLLANESRYSDALLEIRLALAAHPEDPELLALAESLKTRLPTRH